MKPLCASALLFLAAAPLAASSQNTTMASMKGTARPILIFGSARDPRVTEQLRDFSSIEGELRERDIRVVQIPTPNPPTTAADKLSLAILSSSEQQQLRKKFGIAQGSFAVVLIGKDGGKKLISDKPIPWERLQETIDSMPMRKDEVKTR